MWALFMPFSDRRSLQVRLKSGICLSRVMCQTERMAQSFAFKLTSECFRYCRDTQEMRF